MIDLKRPPPPPDMPLAAVPEVQHQEPQKGGSFTRNVVTGDLSSNTPVPAATTEQE